MKMDSCNLPFKGNFKKLVYKYFFHVDVYGVPNEFILINLTKIGLEIHDSK